MNLVIRPVEVNYVSQVWPRVESFLNDALVKDSDVPDWSDCYNIHHVQGFITSGQWLLLVAVDDNNEIHGAATVTFSNYPMNRVAFVTLIGGHLVSSPETFEQLRNLLKSYGATKLQGYGRPAIVRLWKRYGFEPRTTLVEVKL
jgi:hypothetical protein